MYVWLRISFNDECFRFSSFLEYRTVPINPSKQEGTFCTSLNAESSIAEVVELSPEWKFADKAAEA